MVKEYTGVDKIIYDMIEDISKVCTDMRDKYTDQYDSEVLMSAALQASLAFTVSTFIAAGINEPEAHEILNNYYSKLRPNVDQFIQQHLNKN